METLKQQALEGFEFIDGQWVRRAHGATGTEAAVIADIARRQQVGIAKYGTTVRDNPLSLRQWLQHAYEETLDQAVYLKRAIEEMDKPQPETPQ